jgi:hypothetical protein
MTRTRCPFCSYRLGASDVRPLGVVFRCPNCEGGLKVAQSVPQFLPMIAYLGWLIALAFWGVRSFWALLPLAFVTTVLSVSVLATIVTAICGVSIDPVSDQATLALGETRDSGERVWENKTPAETRTITAVWLTRPAVLERVVVLALGLFFFAIDWSGFNKWDPDLFTPKPFREIWWHLPLIVALVFSAHCVLKRAQNHQS